jgi:hypothetical protein
LKKSTALILFWTPRILTILFALFLSIFALDVFGEGAGLWRTLLALFMHLIPTFLIIIFLVLAWRWEWIGAVVYIIFGFLYIFMAFGRFPLSVYFTISGPLFLVGILFLLNWIFRDKVETLKS